MATRLQVSSDSSGFQKLQARFPWPDERPAPEEDAFDWTLDGGGRHLMDALFAQRPIATMVEAGSFMGGSARRWLTTNPTLKLVCIDPWPDNLAIYVRSLQKVDWALKLYAPENLQRYADLLDKHGTISVVRNNLWEFRDRVVMACGRMQDNYPIIAESMTPDLVFTDAAKSEEEFQLAHELFPNSIIAGDDWTWPDSDGAYPVRKYVLEIARKRDAEVFADRQTFVVREKSLPVSFDDKYRYEAAAEA